MGQESLKRVVLFSVILLIFLPLLSATSLFYNNALNDTPTTFDASARLTFQINWTDNASIDTVLIEVNRSGALTNHTATTSIWKTFQLRSDADFLELDEGLDGVGTLLLTKDELATLSNGTVNNSKGTFGYNQTLTVSANTTITYAIDPDDVTDTPSWYLKFDNNAVVYTYTMNFTTPLESDINDSTDPASLPDLEDLTLTLFDRGYFIETAVWDNGGVILNLRKSIGNEIIVLNDTNITSDAVGGTPVVVNSNNVRDVEGQIRGTSNATEVRLDYFTLTWTADEDGYVPLESKLSESAYNDDDQMFLDFDVWFHGIQESESENITLTNVGNDEYLLNFVNKAGNQLNVPLFDVDDTTLRHGNENYDLIIEEGNITTWAGAGVIDRNDYFVISDSSAKNTYLLRYKSLDATNNMIEIEEVWSGDEVMVSFNFTDNQTAVDNFTLGDKDYDVYIYGDINNADIIVDLDGNGTIESGDIPYWYTQYGAYILVDSTPSNGIKFFSEGGNDTVGATGPTDCITVTFANSTANQIDLSSISGNVTLTTIGSTNDKEDYSVWGTHVYQHYSASGPDNLTINYPDNQTEMLVNYTSGGPNGLYSLTLTGFPVGTHAWRSHANESTGIVNSTPWFFFTIAQATPVLNLTLNGTAGLATIEENSSIWLNGSVISGDSNAILTLFLDGVQQNNGTSVSNLTTFVDAGGYWVSLNCTETQNYTSRTVSYFVTVGQDACGVLNSDKTLFSNLTQNGTCFTINASNIVLDGNGFFTIRGNNSGYGIDNSAGYDNITIRDFGGIANYTAGIYAYGVEDSLIENNSITNNEYGIRLIGSSNNNLSKNSVADCNHSLYLENSSQNNSIQYNTFNHTVGDFVNFRAQDIQARYNYWGTTSPSEIAISIVDYNDNSTYGWVYVYPILDDAYPSGAEINSSAMNVNITSPSAGTTITSSSIDINVTTNESAVCWYGFDQTPSTLVPKGTDYVPRVSEPMNSTRTTSTGDELTLLWDDSVTNAKGTSYYTQTLYWPAAVVILNDSNYFLQFSAGEIAYGYSEVFSPTFSSDIDGNNDLDDFDAKTLTLANVDFTIADTNRASADSIRLNLMSTSASDTLSVGETETYTLRGTNYEVTLTYSDGTYAKFTVNGVSTASMQVGETDELADGTEIGVSDLIYNAYGGGIYQAEFYVGAIRLQLQDSNITDDVASHNLVVGSNTATDAYVKLKGTDSGIGVSLSEIHIYWQPTQTINVAEGDNLSTYATDAQMPLYFDLAFFDYIPSQRLKVCFGDSSMSYSSGDVSGDADCIGTTAISNTLHNTTVSLSSLSDGVRTLNIECRNYIAVSTNASLSFTLDIHDDTTPPSSGGGGGGGSTTDTAGATATTVISSVSKKAGIEMSITKDEIPVNKISVEVTDSATNVEISVTAIDEKPESVPEAPKTSAGSARAVYKYLEISHENLAGKIESATIDFKVTKAWLTNNSYDKEQIILQRHTSSGWEELPTEVTKETAANVYYSAKTSAFSVFAISVKEKEQQEEPEQEEEESPPEEFPTEPPVEPPIESPIEPPSKSIFQSTLFTLAVATILGTTGLGYIYRNRLVIGAKIDDLLGSLRRKREEREKRK